MSEHIFHDKNNDKWPIEITYGDIKRLRRTPLGSNGDCGLDLLSITETYDAETGKAKPPLTVRLESDLCLLIDVIYALVKDIADKRNISDEEFGQRMTPGVLLEARKAFWAAVRNFFQAFPSGDMNQAINRQLEAWAELGTQKLLEEAASIERLTRIVKENQKSEEEIMSSLSESLGKGSSLNGQQLSASVQTDSAHDN